MAHDATGPDAASGRSHLAIFSTDFLPERERYDRFLEEIARKLSRIEVIRQKDLPFCCTFRSARLGASALIEGALATADSGRTRALIDDGNDDFVFQICAEAPFFSEHVGRDVAVGEGILVENCSPGLMVRKTAGKTLFLSVPRKSLLALVPQAENLTRLPIVRETAPEMRLMRSYLAMVLAGTPLNPSSLAAAGIHLLDLVALALGATGDAAHEASGRGLRTARREAVRQTVLLNMRDPTLSSADVARANGISERYLRQLFAEGDTSFSDFLLSERLQLARQLLIDPRNTERRIADLAYEAGFSDLSHFNRQFRARFGETPTATRRGAANG